MKNYHIKLVGFPYFFNYSINLSKNEEDKSFIDFNKIFWDVIFSKDILNYVSFSKLEKKDLLILRHVLKNLELSKEIFLLLRTKEINIYNLFFAFNIINTLILFINKNLIYEEIYFYSYFQYSQKIKENLDKTFIYNFFYKNKEFFLTLPDNSILNIKITLSEQLLQLEIIKMILGEINKSVILNIDLSNLREFENKLDFKNIINEIFSKTNIKVNIDLISNYKEKSPSQMILGYSNIYSYIFNKGCNYRKCVFCNIGKFLPKVSEEIDETLKDLLELHKNGSIQTLHVADPDIQPNEILYISDFFSKNNANLKMHIRTRFSKDYTLEVLEKMYEGGVRFMGIGLESASPRINKLMNKYDYDVTTSDFDDLIKNCFKVGINAHMYTIFGFPTETKEEIDMTKDFLLKNLNKYDFFTFTPGIFGINKGTYIFNNPEKFNLEFDKNNISDKTFIKEFYEKNIFKNKEYLLEVIRDLTTNMLTLDNYEYNYIHKFWNFCEHSGLFHIYKMIYKENPFLKFWNSNKSVNYNNYLDNYYNLTKYYQILKFNNEIFLKNWINFKTIKINENILNLFSSYDSNETLLTNLINNNLQNRDYELTFELIENYFFILKPKTKFEIICEEYLGFPFYEREINYVDEGILRKDNIYEILVKKYFYEKNIYKEILLIFKEIEVKTSSEIAFLSYVYALNYEWENAILKMEKVIILENGENIDSFMDFGHFLRKVPKYEKFSTKLLLNIEYYMKIYQENISQNKKISLIEIIYG